MVATETESGLPVQTFELRLAGACVVQPRYVPDTINGTNTEDNNVGKYVLVLYNDDGNPLTTSSK